MNEGLTNERVSEAVEFAGFEFFQFGSLQIEGRLVRNIRQGINLTASDGAFLKLLNHRLAVFLTETNTQGLLDDLFRLAGNGRFAKADLTFSANRLSNLSPYLARSLPCCSYSTI